MRFASPRTRQPFHRCQVTRFFQLFIFITIQSATGLLAEPAQLAGEAILAPADSDQAPESQSLSPPQSLATMRTIPGMSVELVAAEPLVASPVAIDFGPDGKLWVAEMYDYPQGLDGRFQPGGRVRLLEATQGDGRFDKATVFLDGIPFPTGITVWRQGVLVCAAPDILFAQDTDGDGRADVVKKLFSGFGTDNYQARVNSLEYGLDGWVYGSCGLFGGRIARFAGGEPYALGDRDFRIRPDTGDIEPATGRTQQGRVRDDWGNWFGCDNSTLCVHYPVSDDELRRNPFLSAPQTARSVAAGSDPQRLFPLKTDVQLFKLSGPSGRPTAACGLGIYRDTLLGEAFQGNAFTCEPVNLLVHRQRLVPHGSSFDGVRDAGETESEFLAATDNWFRPVQARTGPDGGLWIVDMYRAVIEHPRWIPPEIVAKLDVRAGHDLGRIYRVRPEKRELRPWPRLDRLDSAALVSALDSDNGWQRDMASQMLLWRGDRSITVPLEKLASGSRRSVTRLQALCALDTLGLLSSHSVRAALDDRSPPVRRHAVRLAAQFLQTDPALGTDLLKRTSDDDPQVRRQLACTLGEWRDPRAAIALAALMPRADDEFQVASVFSSLRRDNVNEVVAALVRDLPENESTGPLTGPLVGQLFEMAGSLADVDGLPRLLKQVTSPSTQPLKTWQLTALAGLVDALDRRGESFAQSSDGDARRTFERVVAEAAQTAGNAAAPETARVAAIALLGRDRPNAQADLGRLAELLTPQTAASLQQAAATALARMADPRAMEALLAGWKGYAPSIKGIALDLLLSRDDGLSLLLRHIAQGDISANEIDATRRQRLLQHKRPQIREQAIELFAGATSPDRNQVLVQFKPALGLTGDSARGKVLFAKSCSVCHRLDDVGHAVGPDLAALANKSPQTLLQEILDPSRNLDSRYAVYTALTRAGRTFTGLLAAETASSITLKGQEGKQEVLLRADLDELVGSGKSLMPEGLEKDLSHQAMADILAYLTITAPPPKPFPGNRPQTVQPVDGAVALLASNCGIYGNQIAFETPFRNIGFWHDPNDHVVWSMQSPDPAEYDVWLDWACDDSSSGNSYVLTGAQPAIRGTVAGTGGWSTYRQQRIGTLRLAAGTHRLTLAPDGERLNGALFDLRGIHLVPPGEQPAVAVATLEPAPEVDLAIAARQILDDRHSAADREALIARHLDRAAALIAEMTADLHPGTPEEYRRIPWIWRVAVAAGRKNETEVLKALLETSLPVHDQPLHDWQAVAIGGGIVNGIGQSNVWPRPRIAELVKADERLAERWQRTLALAYAMADNEKTPIGTRYDALRIIPLDNWKKCRKPLEKYLARGSHDELQMGAISGLSDIDRPEVSTRLLQCLGHVSDENRRIALDALLRTDQRADALLTAIENGSLKPAALSDSQRQILLRHKTEALKNRASRLLPESLPEGAGESPKSAAVKKLADSLSDATLKGDYAKVIDLTYEELVEELGGRDEAIKLIEATMKQLAAQGITIKSSQVGAAGDFLTEGDYTFVILPTTVEMAFRGGKATGKSYLLGISPDDGKTWKFADGAGLETKEIRDRVLPKLPAKLKLPEKQKSVIIKDK
ncbi:MAG: c-type cytochrome [Planctomycetaceae bacterium]|nr:c-type cytochrome [Planctomycetaceae bacterium]